LSLNGTDAVREPVATGVNLTLTVQLAAGAKGLPQVPLCEKSPGSAPPSAISKKRTVALPLLVKVICCELLLVPTVCLPKFRLPGKLEIRD